MVGKTFCIDVLGNGNVNGSCDEENTQRSWIGMMLVYVGFFEEKLDMSTSVDIRGLLEK